MLDSMKKFLVTLFLVIVINFTSQFSRTEEISGAVTEAKTIGNNETLTVTTSGTVYLNTNDLISLSGTTSPTLDNSGKIINGSGADGLTDGNNSKTVNFDKALENIPIKRLVAVHFQDPRHQFILGVVSS